MDLALQNPWWRNKNEIEKDEKVSEALQKKVRVLYELKSKKNEIVLGPRQCGKTSMLKLFIYDLITNKNVNPLDICYFSCEPLNNKNDMIEVVKEFEKISPVDSFKYVFLDEVTQISDWELAIKFVLETQLSRRKTIIATGSNALLLKKGSERLPGRNISIRLFLPLSFREFLMKFGSEELKEKLGEKHSYSISDLYSLNKYASTLSIFSEEIESKFRFYLKTGGYLKAVYEMLERGKISENTYEVYVKWLLGDISKLDKREYIFKSVLVGIIKNYGTKFSLHSIAKETEIKSHVTVSDYLDILQGLLLTNQLYQFDYNKKMPLFRKEKKNYFLDPFLYSVCSGYTKGRYQDYSGEKEEDLIEGVVCESLARLVRVDLDISSNLWFYQKRKETDFVLKDGNKFVGIELKWQNKVDKRDFNNFGLFRSRMLLSKREFEFDKENNLFIIPVYLFLSLL